MGMFACAKSVVRSGGVFGLWKGLFATVGRDVPSYGVYFVSYDWLKRKLSPTGEPSAMNMPIPSLLLAGGTAGAAAWVCSYPLDVIKTRLQVSFHSKQ